MPEIPPQADTPAVMDRASYQASKAMLQARLSGEPYIGYAAMGRFAALAVAPVVAEHIARLIEAARPAKPPEADLQRHATLESRLAYNESARIARDAFTAGEPSEPEAPARASTPPYGPETPDPRDIRSPDDLEASESPTALREAIADRLLAEDARSWGYGCFEGSRNTALAVADVMLAVRDDELAALRAELHRMALAYNGANAMMRVHKLSADRRRVELEHAKGALAGDSEAVRLFMEDSSRRVERLREQRDMWQREAEQADAAADRILALAKQARPAAIAACTCWDCEDEEKPNCGRGRVIAWDLDPTAVLAALDVPADGEQTETPEEGPR